MAGKPGRSGGARPNTGGARPGAGRKPKEPTILPRTDGDDPKRFLIDQMQNPDLDARLRIDAAKALMPFLYQKKGEGGIKDQRQEQAKKASSGKFSAATPPKLVVNNR